MRVAPAFEQCSIELSDLLLRAMNWLSEQIVGQATSLARNLLVSVVNFGLMLVALFFFFGDGEVMAARLPERLPMDPAHKDAVVVRLYSPLTVATQRIIV